MQLEKQITVILYHEEGLRGFRKSGSRLNVRCKGSSWLLFGDRRSWRLSKGRACQGGLWPGVNSCVHRGGWLRSTSRGTMTNPRVQLRMRRTRGQLDMWPGLIGESGEAGKARAALQSCRGNPTTGRKGASKEDTGRRRTQSGQGPGTPGNRVRRKEGESAGL